MTRARRWSKPLAALIASALLLLAAPQLLLPAWAERSFERTLKELAEGAAGVSARVESFPALLLVAGRAARIDLSVEGVDVGGLRIDTLRVEGRQVALDMKKLTAGEGIEIKGAKSLTATVTVSERALTEYLWERVPEARSMRIRLRGGEARLEGRANLLGQVMELTVSGHFRVDERSQLVFTPRNVTVAETTVPSALLQAFAQEIVVPLDLSSSGFTVELQRVQIGEGDLLLSGAIVP